MALALAGVDGLRALVTDWDFDEAGFADCVGPALELLARLLQGSAEFDTQLQARGPPPLCSCAWCGPVEICKASTTWCVCMSQLQQGMLCISRIM